MSHVAIIYASTEGQAEKIAHFMGEHLENRGQRVHVQNVEQLSPEFSLDDYDAVIVGGSIHFGKVQKPLRDFVKHHRPHLEAMPSAFYQVCMVVASKRPDAPAEVEQLMRDFTKDTGWHPRRAATFAGALKYSQYGFVTKLIMKAIAKREGSATDTSHDYEYTRWDLVAHFAEDFVQTLSRAA